MRVHVRGGAGEAGGSLSPLYLSFPPVSSLSSAVLEAGGGERKYVSARGRCVPSLRGGGEERATAAHGWCALAPTVSDGCLAPGRRPTAQFRGGDDECKGGNRKHQGGDHERLFVVFQSGCFQWWWLLSMASIRVCRSGHPQRCLHRSSLLSTHRWSSRVLPPASTTRTSPPRKSRHSSATTDAREQNEHLSMPPARKVSSVRQRGSHGESGTSV